MVPVTGAGRLRECKNTEFVWELRKTAFCEDGRKQSFPLTRVSVRRVSTVYVFPLLWNNSVSFANDKSNY